MTMRVQFVGCGDAFGSGGRSQTCIYVQTPNARFLIDCGATSLPALKRCGIDPAALDFVVITHFHGDHYAGLPFLLVEDRIFQRRSRPLTVVGPVGIAERVAQAAESLFPRSTSSRGLSAEFVEYSAKSPTHIGHAEIRAFPVIHSEGTNPHAVRVACDGKVISYSSDTEWTNNLIPTADTADLFICEAYFYEKRVPKHLDYATLAAHRHELNCARLILTHMHDDLLRRLNDVPEQAAYDGLTLELV